MQAALCALASAREESVRLQLAGSMKALKLQFDNSDSNEGALYSSSEPSTSPSECKV